MAVFPVQFPEDWPDFVVTSHIREKGSHASGLAIDIAPVWPSGDYSPSSKFWFYYFHTFFVLWALQNRGVTLMAVPPTCPHFHIHLKQDTNRVGLEWLNKTKSGCVPYYTKTISKLDLMDSIRFRNFVENIVGTGGGKGKYLGAWQNAWESIKNKFDFSKRWVNVRSDFATLSDEKLQNFLNAMYGGSSTDRFLSEMSQIVTRHTWADLKSVVGGNVLLYGSLAAIGYFLYTEHKKSTLARTSIQPPVAK